MARDEAESRRAAIREELEADERRARRDFDGDGLKDTRFLSAGQQFTNLPLHWLAITLLVCAAVAYLTDRVNAEMLEKALQAARDQGLISPEEEKAFDEANKQWSEREATREKIRSIANARRELQEFSADPAKPKEEPKAGEGDKPAPSGEGRKRGKRRSRFLMSPEEREKAMQEMAAAREAERMGSAPPSKVDGAPGPADGAAKSAAAKDDTPKDDPSKDGSNAPSGDKDLLDKAANVPLTSEEVRDWIRIELGNQWPLAQKIATVVALFIGFAGLVLFAMLIRVIGLVVFGGVAFAIAFIFNAQPMYLWGAAIVGGLAGAVLAPRLLLASVYSNSALAGLVIGGLGIGAGIYLNTGNELYGLVGLALGACVGGLIALKFARQIYLSALLVNCSWLATTTIWMCWGEPFQYFQPIAFTSFVIVNGVITRFYHVMRHR